ncbi:MAG TPA: 3'-5' exonuclease [Longimicrobium sp.]|nr:3'-5' exonuclease [Longimicrobium sp.]
MTAAQPELSREDEWLWGWDPTPGIVSVWAEGDGRAIVWRRLPDTGALVQEDERYRPWIVLDRLDDLRHLGTSLGAEGDAGARVWYRELQGEGALRFLVSAEDGRALAAEVLHGASRRLGRRIPHLRELGAHAVLSLPPEEQYLVATGRTYFRDLAFDQLRRLQFDLETQGLDASRDRIFMVAVRHPSGTTEVLEVDAVSDAGEADLIRRLVQTIHAADPDVIENHNLHGFDLPFVAQRARRLGVPLPLGRLGRLGLRERAARRGTVREDDSARRVRFVAPGASSSTRWTPSSATTSARGSCRGTGSRRSPSTWGSRRRTASTCRARRSLPSGGAIRSACGATRRTTWRRWPRWPG